VTSITSFAATNYLPSRFPQRLAQHAALQILIGETCPTESTSLIEDIAKSFQQQL
jgi:hypothetical protein